jgi:hypothetical protein
MNGRDTTQRQEWRKIMEREKRRKEDIEELRKMVESTEGKSSSPTDLIKLLIKAGEIRPEEASGILRVDRSLLDRWCQLLEKRGYLEIDGSRTQNEVLKPTSLLLGRIRGMKEKGRRQVLEEELEREEQELLEKQKELAEERQKRLELEEKLEKANDDLKKKQIEMDDERRKTEQLKARLFELEREVNKGVEEDAKENRGRLEAEQDARAKTEEALRKEKESIEKTRSELEEQKTRLIEEKELKFRENFLARQDDELKQRQQELDWEEEELALLLGEGGPNIQERIKTLLDAIRRKRANLKGQQQDKGNSGDAGG